MFAYYAKWINCFADKIRLLADAKECDASDVAISATLNQGGKPVAFMSRTLQGSEINYPAFEKGYCHNRGSKKMVSFIIKKHIYPYNRSAVRFFYVEQ